jgi:protein-S-isoprenylcysteine O-methyltransferase Ste14
MVFLFYNYYNLNFCLYVGWILIALSVLLILLAGYEFRMKGEAPEGESIVHTTALVKSGLYSVVRHPQYLGFILFEFALVLMSQHWLSIASSVIGTALFYLDILNEEQMSINKFGDDYKHYMERVPRLNIVSGIIRLLIKTNSK